MTLGASASGAVNEDAGHRLAGGAEEVRPVFQGRIALANQPPPGLMSECSGLECLAGSLVSQLECRQAAQRVVHESQQLLRASRLASFKGGPHCGGVAHGPRPVPSGGGNYT